MLLWRRGVNVSAGLSSEVVRRERSVGERKRSSVWSIKEAKPTAVNTSRSWLIEIGVLL